jgi:hypothetical protein
LVSSYVVGKSEVGEECGHGFKILKSRKEVYFYYRYAPAYAASEALVVMA